ncbi:MAG TPA: adenylate/guanylate cyclase domain-containing protein [Mycobacteriales bacterium]|nr:adenylate/guanylate cyclase domain-containing protein [Mycobacteriales bacterium]
MEPTVGTFGFIDLAGFTALTEVHGDHEAVDLLDRFEALVSDALAGTGTLVKTIGDAVMLRFDEPALAVTAIGRTFDAATAVPNFPLARAGLHEGPAVARDRDWIGASVNLAARVTAQASGGELLATSAVAAAAFDLGFDVADLGPTRLSNVTEPIALFAITVGSEDPATVLDPVCRMRVVCGSAAGHLRFEGRDVWFCSLACVSQFSTDPRHYALPS